MKKFCLLALALISGFGSLTLQAERYVIVAKRNTTPTWFYMTADLGTAETKRYQAVDTETEDITAVETSGLEDIYYWEIADNKYLKNSGQFSYWTKENMADLNAAEGVELTIGQENGAYTFSFPDGEKMRYLALNKDKRYNYFAYYLEPSQTTRDLFLIAEGEKAQGIQAVSEAQDNRSMKRMVNGRLLIERNGRTYNAMGVEQ